MQRPLILRIGALAIISVLSASCSSSPSLASQLAPSGSVTLTGLTISVNPPPVGSGAQATATATFSNGSTSLVASGFGTDTPSVATATTGGAITGVSIGDVTIFVDYQGTRASKKVRVLPGYGGTFGGTYQIANCATTGGFVSADSTLACSTFTTGLVLSIAIQNTQSADLTTMTGQFGLGNVVGSGSGTVSSTGGLTYTGALTGNTVRMDFRNFVATSPAPGRIAGTFEMVWTDSTTTGTLVITCTNLDMTRQ